MIFPYSHYMYIYIYIMLYIYIYPMIFPFNPIQEDYVQNIHHINPAYELCMKPYNRIQTFHKQIFTPYSCNKLE